MKNLIYLFSISSLLCIFQITSAQVQVGQTLDGRNLDSRFGNSSAISQNGNTIVIGGYHDDLNDPLETGYVEVYNLIGGNWVQKGLTLEGASVGFSSFGNEVDISNDGDRILVGSKYAFFVFDWNGSTWVQVANNPSINYVFGQVSLDLSGDGNTVVYGETGPYTSFDESIEVYELNGSGTAWQLKGNTLYPPNPNGNFGGSCALNQDGTVLVAGARGIGGVSRVYVYEFNGSSWVPKGTDFIGGVSFGKDVDINSVGDRIIASGHYACKVLEFQNGDWSQLGNDMLPSTISFNDVSINDAGNIVAVGSKGATGDLDGNVVYSLDNSNNWVQVGIEIWSERANDDFANSIDLDGQGSRLLSGAGENLGWQDHAGYAKVFNLNIDCSWNKVPSLEINGESSNDLFGFATKYTPDGNILISGSPYGDGNGSNSGEVRIFEKSGNSWNQRGATLIGEAAGDQFGFAVAISDNGKYVVVGARYNDDGGSNAGHARMFKWNGSNYVQYGADINGTGSSDYTGFAVDISNSGKYFAVASPYNDDAGSNSGKVQLYKRSSTNHIPVGPPIYGSANNEFIGRSISLSGFGWRIAIGAMYNDDAASNAGQVQIYDYNSQSHTWNQVGLINGNNAYDYFGTALSFSADDNTISIGAYLADPNGSSSGQVRVFTQSGPTWIQKGNSLNGQNSGDRFGTSTSLSASGNRIVVGTPYSDLNGSSSGHITVFDYIDETWTQIGAVVTGDSGGDYYGTSVSIVGNGTSIAVAARGDDNNGSSSGSVQIIETCSSNTKSMTTSGNSTISSDYTPTVRTSKGVSVFPNPTAGLLEIQGISAGIKLIQLFDNSGALVFSQEISGNNFNIGELLVGTYHLVITHEGNDYQLTVVKK